MSLDFDNNIIYWFYKIIFPKRNVINGYQKRPFGLFISDPTQRTSYLKNPFHQIAGKFFHFSVILCNDC